MELNRIKSYLTKKGEFRYNVISGTIELIEPLSKDAKILDDYFFNSLRIELCEAGMRISLNDLYGLLFSSFSTKYDPIQEYFRTLPPWTPDQPDYIRQLADTISVDDQELWSEMLRKWLVASVKCGMGLGVNSLMIILTAAQGLGKTLWMTALIPSQLKPYCSSGTINFKDKDSTVNLSECFLIFMDEMANFRKGSYAELKEWLSKELIKVRRPYKRTSESMTRRSNFMGATNEATFLYDQTGSRRFLCFEPFDINYEHGIDINRVYAQAKYLLESGYLPYLTQKEIERIQLHNSGFTVKTLEEELVNKHFIIPEDENGIFLTATDIMEWVVDKDSVAVQILGPENIGRALKSLGFKRIKKGESYGYLVEYRGR